MVTITTSTLGMILSMLYIVQNMYVFEYIYISTHTHTHTHTHTYINQLNQNINPVRTQRMASMGLFKFLISE